MIRADKDILCGIYPKKEINWYSVKQAMDRGVQSLIKLKYAYGQLCG